MANSIWVHEFSIEGLKKFFEEFLALEDRSDISTIVIYLASGGGEANAFMAMRDLIKSSKKPVAIIAAGEAQSCGAFFLACGTAGLRYAAEHTELMLHEVSQSAPDSDKASDSVKHAEDMVKFNELLFNNLSSDTGTPADVFLAEIHDCGNRDWIFTAKEAKKLGLIDHIGIPRLEKVNGIYPVLTLPQVKEKRRRKK